MKAAGIASTFDTLPEGVDILQPDRSFVSLREEDVDWTEEVIRQAECTEAARLLAEEANNGDTKIDNAPCELDDLLPDPCDPADASDDAVFRKADAWLKVDNKDVHKASVVRIVLGDDDILKSKDCLRRVRGYSNDPSKPELNNADDTILDDAFIIG